MSLICLAAGGTAGHLFPAAALAAELEGRGLATHLLTDTRGLKYAQGFEATPRTEIASGSVVGAGLVKKLKSGLSIIGGVFQARKALRTLKPDVLVGFGGYPSFPPMIAAWSLGIPSVLHEQNAVMGLANRHASRFAKKIALSFDPTKGQAKPDKASHVGNPVRADISAIGDLDPAAERLTVLVFAGSQGARVMADLVPEAVCALPADLKAKVRLVLQIREEDQDRSKQILERAGLRSFEIHSFLNPMATYLEQAHLVLCRSGATSVCEMAAAGRPAIFIPLELHADGQQSVNAGALVKVGAAKLAKQSTLTPQDLSKMFEDLLSNPAQLLAMGQAARTQATPAAAKNLADLVLTTGNIPQ